MQRNVTPAEHHRTGRENIADKRWALAKIADMLDLSLPVQIESVKIERMVDNLVGDPDVDWVVDIQRFIEKGYQQNQRENADQNQFFAANWGLSLSDSRDDDTKKNANPLKRIGVLVND